MEFDKSTFIKTTFSEADHQKKFWLTKSYTQRLEAGMMMTKIAFGLVNEPEIKMDKILISVKSKRG